MERKPSTGPLQGIRILDLTRLYPGPLGTMLLADMGAEVIKIEDMNSPDAMRRYPPFVGPESAGYLAVNRSKRSLALNLRDQKGVDIFFSLLKTADIVVEQFRPGVLDKMGLGYESARKVKADIIYLSITGYGQSGPYAHDAGHDINYIGYAGIISATGSREGGPALPGLQIADAAGGAYMTVIACLSALWARQSSGEGQRVDLAMLDATLPLMTLQMAHYQATGKNPVPGKEILSGGLPCYGVYRCADGKYIALGALEDKFWKGFCEMIESPEWIGSQFVSGRDAESLRSEMAALFKTRTREQWISAAAEHDVCLTPVLELEEIEMDPQVQARKMIIEQTHPAYGTIKGIGIPLKFSTTPAAPAGPPPLLGEDGAAILREIGYSEDEIKTLGEKGVVLVPGETT